MPLSRPELWAALRDFVFDAPGASLPFTDRLARDCGWTRDFARRTVDEYRRFVYLAAVAGHPVTPSDEVDQAWHLHLVYTRSYWKELCEGILGFELHHGPTRGGRTEGRKFADWYDRTRESYRREFETAPPIDLWPPPALRFGLAPHFVRANRKTHWILPKARVRGRLKAAGAVALLALATGCASALTSVRLWVSLVFVGGMFVFLLYYIRALASTEGGWAAVDTMEDGPEVLPRVSLPVDDAPRAAHRLHFGPDGDVSGCFSSPASDAEIGDAGCSGAGAGGSGTAGCGGCGGCGGGGCGGCGGCGG
ncbi:MAG: hypothetical protein R3F20_02335 [Planctomycetota bacterium]